MNIRTLTLPLLLAFSTPAMADAPAAPPKLLVAIAVDQFSADLFAQYRAHFTGGLARLLQGAVFPSAYQSHAATETCPGHSTILTGVHPARSGIVANNWYDPGISRPDKRIYCAEDESDPASTSRDPVVSAHHLLVPTLGERMKAQWPESRNVAVSGKDRAVMMMGGNHIDAAYWWKGQGFVTLKEREIGPYVLSINTAIAAKLASQVNPAKTAEPSAEFTIPAWCEQHDRAVTAGTVKLGQGHFPLEAGKEYEQFRVSPRLDTVTLALASGLAAQMKLGQGAEPDMLSVSLSATDYIGHAFGTQGLEMCVQMAELDDSLNTFFGKLDASGIDYAVVLTADHGGLDVPERLDQQALPSASRVDPALTPAALDKSLAAQLAIITDGPMIYGDGPFGDLYLSHSLNPEQTAKVSDALVALLKAHPQVAAAFTAADLAKAPMPKANPQDWTLLDRARASFVAGRSGDVVMLLNRAVVPIPVPAPGYTATHGSAWDYDRRVPLLFWRKGMVGFEQPAPVETVDIAPSLAALIGLKVPEGEFDGRCLDVDGGPGDSCK